MTRNGAAEAALVPTTPKAQVTPSSPSPCNGSTTIADALAELLVAWRRRGVRVALEAHDDSDGAERRVIDAYDRLVDAESHRGAA